MYSRDWTRSMLAGAGLLLAAGLAHSQVESTPVDLTEFWNVDAWEVDATDTKVEGVPGLDDGGARIQSGTLPDDFVDLQPNLTEDGQVEFLFGPTQEVGALDAYRPQGETIDVPDGQYDFLYLATMSGQGNFPSAQWEDSDTMTFNYADGTTETADIGYVNDWFWTPPLWVTPASGNEADTVVDLIAHDSDINEADYLYDWTEADIASQSHDFGQYRFANGDQYLVYQLPYEEGAKLYLRAWGNLKIEISTEDPATEGVATDVVFSSTQEFGEVFPGGGDGYLPEQYEDYIVEVDLSLYLSATDDEFFLRFTDAAPGEAPDGTDGNWGARIAQIGIFQGEVEESRLGARLWTGLVRDDDASPSGGLQLLRKGYRLDNTKTLDSITMPDLQPETAPLLTVFGMTLAVGEAQTEVLEFMLY